MTKERNKHIACLVLQGRTYDSVGIEYDISRERVYQIVRRIMREFAPVFIAHKYRIRELRKDCNRLISKIKGTNDAK
jgi:DNA-directed RNA polymerase sigma subunit (sigma70/sigma32)